mmetsp:Transcript_49984/g.92964  ORF Transcript_49984/g.92964 Transcript_49984/m.92964 type:complete len:452 (-) Transcript_49984:177-1532(-)
MSSIRCRFEIQGLDFESCEAGTTVEVEILLPMTLELLENAFPFEGIYHFRQKIYNKSQNNWVWADVLPGEAKLASDTKMVEILALPLSFGFHHETGSLYPDWGNALAEEERSRGWRRQPAWASKANAKAKVLQQRSSESLEGLADRVDDLTLEAKKKLDQVMASDAAVKIGQKSVAVGKVVGKLFSSGLSAVVNSAGNASASSSSSRGGGGKPPTVARVPGPGARDVLERLSADLGTRFDGCQTPQHADLATRLWAALVVHIPTSSSGQTHQAHSPPPPPPPPAESFVSQEWKNRCGFVSDDALGGDMGKTGVLALKALVYFTDTYNRKALRMATANSASVAANYPFGIVAVNLTLMLVDVLGLRQRRFLGMPPAAHWGVFEHDIEDSAFNELFCLGFGHIDFLWRDRKATRADFGAIIKQTKSDLQELLAAGPVDLEDLLQRANRAGLVH